jgi:3'-phosphoadenosine 5'-phosphosulfate sulfotransferase (PAPS reductase)/FAD synthetase
MRDPFIINEPTCISFSGGRTSAYLLWRVLQSNNGLPEDAIVCFANTGKEEEATLEFVRDCGLNWGVKIHWIEYTDAEKTKDRFKIVDFDTASRNGEPFEQLIVKKKYLPNPVARFCTSELKIIAIDRFLKSIGINEYTTAVGIRADEQRRAAKMKDKLTPLIAANVDQSDVQKFWQENTFNLGIPFANGITPLGNCDLCFLKGKSQITSLIADKPERAVWWAAMEAKIGGTWRSDRPSYEVMAKTAADQTDLFVDESISCFCGD